MTLGNLASWQPERVLRDDWLKMTARAASMDELATMPKEITGSALTPQGPADDDGDVVATTVLERFL